MSESIYKPQKCAFHPKEYIVNFCKNQECLLPLCPSCIKVHTQEHQREHTYGQFQNIHKVVNDLDSFFQKTVKDLNNSCEDIKDQQVQRKKEQEDLRKRINEAKKKMMSLIDRFFDDFQKEVNKSVLNYNESMKENYEKVNAHIDQLKLQIKDKETNLTGDKVLKTLISFHAKGQKKTYTDQVQSIANRISYLDSQKVEVVWQPTAYQRVIDQLGNYIYLSFQNWENQVKYMSQFVKTGFMSTGSDGFQKNNWLTTTS